MASKLIDTAEWSAFLAAHAAAGGEIHLLQTTAWGELKSKFGWQVVRLLAGDSGAQVLIRPVVARLGRLSPSVAYLAKGPVGTGWAQIMPLLDELCRAHKAVFLKIEPDLWDEEAAGQVDPVGLGLFPNPYAIQPPRTVTIDIRPDEEQILAGMKQKTRYNVRLAQKKGVQVHPSTDFETFRELMEVTGKRDGFGVHSMTYYQTVHELFHEPAAPHEPACELLLAEYEGQPLSALMVFACGRRSYYLYGASNDLHRDLMSTYLLQWEAMRWARARGCSEYDLWGIPDEEEETLEAHFTDRHDGLWGVYRFKRGFGGQVKRAAGPWDKIYNPFLYRLYQWRVSRQAPGMGG
jgi:peptidoglycan pentaglycine glycine transferase (the first glycine)